MADNARNLTDDQLRGIAATGGMVGIGFWPTACGGDDAAAIARSIAYAAGVAGVDHVGLGPTSTAASRSHSMRRE